MTTTLTRAAPPTREGLVVRHPLASFFALAYVFAWACWLPLVLTDQTVVAGDGWPTHVPGLLGPAVAAFVVTARTRGRAGLRDLLGRMLRWRVGWQWYAAVAAPVVFYVAVLGVRGAATGTWPSWRDLGSYSGLPAALGIVGSFAVALVLNGLGEETGWRGFALPLLQRRHGPLVASLLLTLGWAAWHTPLFFTLKSFEGFDAVTLPGFLFGMACGAVILTWVYNGTGGSVLLVALWHTAYNMTTATTAATGTLAAVVSTFVMVWAIWLVVLDLTASRRGRLSPLRIRS